MWFIFVFLVSVVGFVTLPLSEVPPTIPLPDITHPEDSLVCLWRHLINHIEGIEEFVGEVGATFGFRLRSHMPKSSLANFHLLLTSILASEGANKIVACRFASLNLVIFDQ